MAEALSSFLDVAEASEKGGSAIQEATETKASQASKDSKDSGGEHDSMAICVPTQRAASAGTRDKNDKEAVKASQESRVGMGRSTARVDVIAPTTCWILHDLEF